MYLVTGATGNVGSEVVRSLTERGAKVRAVGRTAPRIDGTEGIAADLNDPRTLAPALSGVHGVFLLPGYPGLRELLALAKKSGVQRAVLLSGGSVLSKDTGNAVSRYMLDSEAAAHESGLAWTVLRPSAFMANALRWADQIRGGGVVRAPFPDVPAAAIDPRDIGAVAAAALTEDGHEGNAYRISGPESLLPAEQVRVLGEVLGRELRFEGLTNDEAWAEMTSAMPEDYVRAFFSFYADGNLDESVVLPTVRELLGREPRTFREWAAEHADAFRA